MIEELKLPTIRDMQIRYVYSPKEPSYSAPHVKVQIPCQQSFDQGWNAAVAYYKAVGKI